MPSEASPQGAGAVAGAESGLLYCAAASGTDGAGRAAGLTRPVGANCFVRAAHLVAFLCAPDSASAISATQPVSAHLAAVTQLVAATGATAF